MKLHKEGKTTLTIEILAFSLFNYLAYCYAPEYVAYFTNAITAFLFIMTLNFFRIPKREFERKEGIVYAPCDGKVVVIEETEETESSEEDEEESSDDDTPQNPLLLASDLTVGQNMDKSFSTILTMGISQSSMAGDVTYGATGMVWSNLNQFALAGSYTKMNFTPEGALNDIDNYTLAGAYMNGSYMAMFGYTWVKSHLTFGTFGYNLGVISMFTKNNEKFEKSFIGNVALFWTKPFVVSERLAISPQIFLTNNPVMYQHNITEFISNQDLSGMLGAAFDFAITRRFAFSTAYRLSGATVSEVPILHFFMIGSRLVL